MNKDNSREIMTLSNGLKAVAAPMKHRHSVAMGIWVHTGGRDEEARVAGVSHFLEHMLFKGTKTRTTDEIKESVEGVGGTLNAFTGEEYTCFLAKAAHRHFERVFEVLADMILNASLKEAEIKKERAVIMEEIKMTQDQPGQLAEELLSEITWPGHPLGRPIAGTLETVSRLSREDLKKYMRHFYAPPFITVAAAGAIDEKSLLKTVERHFGDVEAGAVSKKLALFTDVQPKARVRLLSKQTEQAHLAFATHTFQKDHPDETALDLLNIIVGGNMSSRLFNEVREKRGLAYDVSSFVRKYHETGAFGVDAGVDVKKAHEALAVILKELAKMTRLPVSRDELKRAKEFYLGQMELGLENSMNQMLWAGESVVCLGRRKTPEEVIRKVHQVTAGDLKSVARRIFRPGLFNLAVVGPGIETMQKKFHSLLSSGGF